MDVEFLSRMIGELILDNSSLALPGLGTFEVEEMPASFSDRGYTVNPPYRRLSFTGRETGDNLLSQLYASWNHIQTDEAAAIIGAFLSELKETLQRDKSVELPGLGRLRATRENHFFFVADEDLDISPDACGLVPVSLKSRRSATLPDVPVTPTPPAASETPVFGSETADIPPAAHETPVLGSETTDISPAAPEPTVLGSETADISPAAPEPTAPGSETTDIPPAAPETPVLGSETADISPAAPELTAPGSETADFIPEISDAPAARPAKTHTISRPLPKALRWTLGTIGVAAALLLAFVLASRLAPGSTDWLLYTPEELAIINTPEDGSGLPL